MTRIVIMGGGPAGYEAALVAVQHGADVTVVERDGMGGACVLDDCVPSKTFIASAGVRVEMRRRRARRAGRSARVARGSPSVNGRVKNLALAQSADVRARLEREGIRIIRGTARFAATATGSAHVVEAVTGDGREELSARSCWSPPGRPRACSTTPARTASGSSPAPALRLRPELPEHLIVVGRA